MLEKIRDYISKQMKAAYHTVTKSFRLFLPVFIAIFLIQCLLFTVFLSYRQNRSLREEQVRQEFNYHLTVSGLTESEMLLLRNDDRTVSRNDMCFEVIKAVRYDSEYYDPGYTVYIKLLTGNKNYGIFAPFIDDSLSKNYADMRYRYEDVFGSEEEPSERISISFSPLYTQEDDIAALRSQTMLILLSVSLICCALFSFIYRIYIRNRNFIYGLYSAFGASLRDLCAESMTELFLIALFTLLPSYYITSFLCFGIYRANEITYSFSLITVSTWLSIFLITLAILFIAILLPLKQMSREEPQALLSAEENTNAVTSPRRSVSLLNRPFPLGYELLSLLRFRRHYLSVAFTSALLSVVFILGFYLTSIYTDSASLRYRTEPHFKLHLSGSEEVREDHLSIFKSVKGLGSVYALPSYASASDYASLLHVPQQNVVSTNGLVKDKENGIYYTGDVEFISGGSDLVGAVSSTYQISGSPGLLFEDTHNVIIGSTYQNKDAFSFSIGDQITLAIANVDENGAVIYLDKDQPPLSGLTGRHFWKAAHESFSFRYETFTVVGVIEDYPSGARGVPIVMHPNAYETVTGVRPQIEQINVHMPEMATMKDFTVAADKLYAIAARLGTCTLESDSTFFENRVEPLYCLPTMARAINYLFVAFIPLTWIYAQALFFRKREKEFFVLNAISATPKEIRTLFFSGSLLILPIALVSLLTSGLICGVVFLLTERFLPNVLGISGLVAGDVGVLFKVYVLSTLVTLISCLISATLPYFSYRKKFLSESAANSFYDES